MSKIEIKDLQDLSAVELETLEETHVDTICEIMDNFRAEIKVRPEDPVWALDSAIEDAKGLSEEVSAYILPFRPDQKLLSASSSLLRLYTAYVRDTFEPGETPKATQEVLDYARKAQRLSKVCSIPMGSFLADRMGNEDRMDLDQIEEEAKKSVMGACLAQVTKEKVNGYLLDSGKAVLSAGIKSMKEHPNYSALVEEGKRFKEAESAFKPEYPGFGN